MADVRPLPVVIGTAGHIDHGKSSLVEALCGTHPDRWREERERGITLDLGYAQLTFPDGLEVGFVDVPGHERLVRKMVAGATGMSAALLAVACDDSVMPQTREHFEVLRLLGVAPGLVALTKADLADDEMRAFARAEVEELVAGSDWEGCEVVEVSAHTGEGMDELREAVRRLALAARERHEGRAARRSLFLPVQRSFAIQGAGTVVTGVLDAGTVAAGEVVEVLPARRRSRVRRVQVHGREAEAARPGLRTAVNLPDAEPADCPRGAVVARPDAVPVGRLARAVVSFLPGAPVPEHGAEVQVLAHTAAVLGRVFYGPEDDAEGLAPGERFVDLELDEDLALVPGLRMVLRRPSPARNLGVARFLGFGGRRLRRRDREERAAWLRLAAAGDDPEALVLAALRLHGAGPKTPGELAALLGWDEAAVRNTLDALVASDRVAALGRDRFLAAEGTRELLDRLRDAVEHFRAAHPERLRVPVQRLRDRLGKAGWRVVEGLPDAVLEGVGLERGRGTEWRLLGAEAPPEVAAAGEALRAALESGGMQPGDWPEVVAAAGIAPDLAERARAWLLDTGGAVRVAEGILLARSVVEDFRTAVVAQLEAGTLDIPALRDRFATTRKYVMPLLEYLDECGVTERRGPNRLLKRADAPVA